MPTLAQGTRRRLGEDAVASRVVLRALARGCGCGEAAAKLDLGLTDAAAVANGTHPGPDRGSLDGSPASASFEHLQVPAQQSLQGGWHSTSVLSFRYYMRGHITSRAMAFTEGAAVLAGC